MLKYARKWFQIQQKIRMVHCSGMDVCQKFALTSGIRPDSAIFEHRRIPLHQIFLETINSTVQKDSPAETQLHFNSQCSAQWESSKLNLQTSTTSLFLLLALTRLTWQSVLSEPLLAKEPELSPPPQYCGVSETHRKRSGTRRWVQQGGPAHLPPYCSPRLLSSEVHLG